MATLVMESCNLVLKVIVSGKIINVAIISIISFYNLFSKFIFTITTII